MFFRIYISRFLPWFCRSSWNSQNLKIFIYFRFFNWRIIALQCCVSAAQPCKSAVYIHIYPLPLKPPSLPPPSAPSRSSQSTELSSQCCTAASTHHLFYTWWCIQVSTTLSVHSPLLLPLLNPQVCSSHLRLYSYPANRFIHTIFLDFIKFFKIKSTWPFMLKGCHVTKALPSKGPPDRG